jgi:hypothetical protein
MQIRMWLLAQHGMARGRGVPRTVEPYITLDRGCSRDPPARPHRLRGGSANGQRSRRWTDTVAPAVVNSARLRLP